MKKYISIISLILCLCFILPGCVQSADNKPNEDTTTTTDDTNTDRPAAYDENGIITVSYNGKEESGNGSVEMKVSGRYSSGGKIEITIPEDQHFLAVTIAKDVLEESIVYLKNNKFSYVIPDISRTYPSELAKSGCTISARIPTLEELSKKHNLALNTCDLLNARTVFPHATSNNVHEDNNNPDWFARNVIDGFTQNTSHGSYPYQSWGPKNTMSAKDYIKIDFGHDVSVEELVLYLRADFDHDGYWGSFTVEFSDGSTLDITSVKKASKAQTFKFDEPVVTSSLKFSNFEKGSGI